MRRIFTSSLMIMLLFTFSCEKENNSDFTDTTNNSLDTELITPPELLQPGMKESKANLDAKFSITKTKADVQDFVNGGIVVGKATLWRGQNGVFLIFFSDQLIPHHAYTIWWGAWNGPENCAIPGFCGLDPSDFANAALTQPEFMYATGRVARHNGKAYFWAFLGENDDSGTVNPLFGLPPVGGMLDAQNSDMQAILRSHGPAIPGQIFEQVSSYEGGCTEFLPAFSEIPLNEGQCADIFLANFPAP